jgi:hypothetical protein
MAGPGVGARFDCVAIKCVRRRSRDEVGVATPWFRICILASLKNRPSLKGLLRHEVVHIRQMQRDGWFTFWTQYFWWTLTKGYAANPYEVEAYRVSHPVLHGLL